MSRRFRLPWDPMVPSDPNIPVHRSLMPVYATPPRWPRVVLGIGIVVACAFVWWLLH